VYTELVLTLNDAEAAPDGTEMLVGAMIDPLVEIATVAPVVVAADRVAVHDACPPGLSEVGVQLKPATVTGGASRVMGVD
jgi:hypothetical protein